MANFTINPLRERQIIGMLFGTFLGVVLFIFLTRDSNEQYLSLGPMNHGHEDFNCNTCHADAQGNLWQQMQSNIQYTMGLRKSAVDFGTLDVETKKCLACHDRDNDRHPTHRFLEPKFKKAVSKLNSADCNTCHAEHNGARITLAKTNYCVNCHEDLTVKNDPIDIPHATLIKNNAWDTCLQCHDFHGNHEYKTPTKIKDTIPTTTLKKYFNGGEDPYSKKKKFVALSEKEWIQKYLKK